MRVFTQVALILGLQWGLTAPATGFELDEILDAPYASQLVSARAADRVAWVSYEKGVRNIWMARSPAYDW